MSGTEPTSVKDVDGRTVRKGDMVRVLGIPDLNGMRDPYRRETEAVFKHITGTRKKVCGFDQFGAAILVSASGQALTPEVTPLQSNLTSYAKSLVGG